MQGVAVMENDLLDKAVQAGSFGGSFGFVFLAARWLLLWLTGRHDRREDMIEAKDAALDERWAKYTKKIEERYDTLDERCQRMEAEVETCHADKRDLERRLAILEGFDQGLGDWRQEEQRTLSFKNVFDGKGEQP